MHIIDRSAQHQPARAQPYTESNCTRYQARLSQRELLAAHRSTTAVGCRRCAPAARPPVVGGRYRQTAAATARMCSRFMQHPTWSRRLCANCSYAPAHDQNIPRAASSSVIPPSLWALQPLVKRRPPPRTSCPLRDIVLVHPRHPYDRHVASSRLSAAASVALCVFAWSQMRTRCRTRPTSTSTSTTTKPRRQRR